MTARVNVTWETLPVSYIDAALSNAFEIINHAPKESLLARTQEAIPVLQKLSDLFSANQSSKSLLPAKKSQSETQLSEPITPSVSALLHGLVNRKKIIEARRSSPEPLTFSALIPQESERSLSSNRMLFESANSSQDPIQKGLSYRRLGLEYEKWE